MFVGKHLVDAADRPRRRRRGAQPGQDGELDCRPGWSGSSPIAPTPIRCGAVLAGREWDAVFDVSGFVMAAGGSDIDGLLDLLDGQRRRLRVHQLDHGLRPVVGRPFPVDRGPAVQSGRAVAATAGSRRWSRRQSSLAMIARGFPGSVARPAAVYGPDNNIFDMELPMFLRLLQHRPILVPHGGLVVGSYGHVDDLCSSMIAMAASPVVAWRGVQRFGRVGRRQHVHRHARCGRRRGA